MPHAVHMHGHELRRLGRINEAIARFEAADKLERAYVAREKISVAGSQSYRRDGQATHFFTVNVASVDDLRRTLALIDAVPGVISASRR